MSNYTHLNNIAVQGSIESSAQGKLIGSFDTMPAASSINAGQIVLYTGATGTYVQGKYYVSNGTSWVLSAASPTAVTVDSALSTTSTNPVQNKVVATALNGKVDTVSGKGLSTNDYTTAEKTKLSGIATGAQVNVIESVKVNGTALTPTSKAVNIDLSNYATKGDVSAIPKFAISVVTTLPTSGISTSTIYLKSNGGSSGNSYDEYIYVNNAWEKIGTTEVDLSGYVPTSRTVNGKALTGNITLAASDVGALATGGTAAKATADASGNNIVNTYATKIELTNGLAGKQNNLTFDSAPTSGSSNPVTSGGVYSAINTTNSNVTALQNTVAGKQDKLTIDSTPTSGSSNPVTSGGVYTAINNGSKGDIEVVTSFPSQIYSTRFTVTSLARSDIAGWGSTSWTLAPVNDSRFHKLIYRPSIGKIQEWNAIPLKAGGGYQGSYGAGSWFSDSDYTKIKNHVDSFIQELQNNGYARSEIKRVHGYSYGKSTNRGQILLDMNIDVSQTNWTVDRSNCEVILMGSTSSTTSISSSTHIIQLYATVQLGYVPLYEW